MLVTTEHDGVAGILSELDRSPRHRRVGSVASVGVAGTSAVEAGADVVVVDMLTPSCIARLEAVARVAPTVVVSCVPPERALLPCVAVGVRGFVWKPDVPAQLEHAITAVAAGRTHLDPFRVDWLAADPTQNGVGSAEEETLSARQRQILALVLEGLGNAEIALALGTSVNTVKTHLQRAMGKLDAEDRRRVTELVSSARKPRRRGGRGG